MICYFLNNETHLPTRCRLLATLGILLYCNGEKNKNIPINLDEWSKKEYETATSGILNEIKLILSN